MSYPKNIKNTAIAMLKAGVTITEVEKQTGITRRTLHTWTKGTKATNWADTTLDGLQFQIQTLSQQEPTDSTAKKMAMLTKSLDRVQKRETKQAPQKTILPQNY